MQTVNMCGAMLLGVMALFSVYAQDAMYGRAQTLSFAQALSDTTPMRPRDSAFYSAVVPLRVEQRVHAQFGSGLGHTHVGPFRPFGLSVSDSRFKSIDRRTSFKDFQVGYIAQTMGFYLELLNARMKAHGVYPASDGSTVLWSEGMRPRLLLLQAHYYLKTWRWRTHCSMRPYVSGGVGYGQVRVVQSMRTPSFFFGSTTARSALAGSLGSGLRFEQWQPFTLELSTRLYVLPAQPSLHFPGGGGLVESYKDKRAFLGVLGLWAGWLI
jgi:hypothetical protein